MFRRPRPPQPPKSGVVQDASPAPGAAEQLQAGAEATRILGELLARPTLEGVLEGALAQAVRMLGGDMRGYAVLRRGQDQVAAVHGYPRALVGTALCGPWAPMRARLLPTGSKELYEANPAELHSVLNTCGMNDVRLSLVLPLTDRGRHLGALMLDRTGEGGVTPGAQEAVTRWASATAPLLGLLESREEWKVTARHITASVVEALESREFDALGHAQAVAEVAGGLGRALNLSEREQEELWYAATLHDLGKLHGEEGHPQIGANFLHGVPQLHEAQRAIRHHHERWDGDGLPERLRGEDIPLYARVLAVANAYVRAGTLEAVQAQSGQSLEPRLVELLGRVLDAEAGAPRTPGA